MKKSKLRIILVGIAALTLFFGCAVSENYKMGQDLVNQNRWAEAIGYFENAVKEEPGNNEYKVALSSARRQAANIQLEKAKQALVAAPAKDLRALEAIVKQGEAAFNLDPENQAVKAFQAQLKEKVADLQAQVKAIYEKADADMQKEDWLAAVNDLKAVNKVYPGYEDTGAKLARAEQEGAKLLYQQGVIFGKQEDWKMATESFKAAIKGLKS